MKHVMVTTNDPLRLNLRKDGMRRYGSFWCPWAVAMCAVAFVACVRAQPAQVDPADIATHSFDDWFVQTLDDRRCGYARYRMAVVDDRLVTIYDEHIVESHGGEHLTYSFTSGWIETLDFEPIQYRIEERDGAEAVVKTYRFTDGGIELTSEQGGRRTATTLPLPEGDWLTPGAFVVAVDRAMVRGDEEIELLTWDPQLGDRPYTVRYDQPERVGRALLSGEVAEVTRWRVAYSYLPGLPTYEFFDGDRRPLGYSFDIGGGMIAGSYRADASVAELAFDPPEMAQRSVIVPDQPIEEIDSVRRAVYELSFGGGNGRIEILPPILPHQKVERLADRSVRVTVDLDAAGNGGADDLPTAEHLAATIAVDHTDPEVSKLADSVQRWSSTAQDPRGYATACERFVSRYVSGVSLAVGNATASEVARSREGDCTECAVLLAAMLRAKGIPSRCVSGLVYSADAFVGVEHAFVYHMWTQAWIPNDQAAPEAGGRWVDLDSAMLGYSAGHIALGVTAVGEDADAEELRLVPMTLDLSVAVKETAR